VRSNQHQLTLSKISERQWIKFSAENERKEKLIRENFDMAQYCLEAPLIYELLCVRIQSMSLKYLNMKVKYLRYFDHSIVVLFIILFEVPFNIFRHFML